MSTLSRRTVLAGAATLLGTTVFKPLVALADDNYWDPQQIYAPVEGEPFPVPAVNLKRIHPQFYRTVVEYPSNEAPGTIIINPADHHLFVINGDGRAIRYGVGVGREGFLWSGEAHIQAKREWPDWYPPNPLGARAMYLYQGNKHTLYRIHGTIEPWTIGSSVSSGCIRMVNQDVIDLYSRIPQGTKVMVLGNAHPNAQMAERRVKPENEAIPSNESAQDYRRQYGSPAAEGGYDQDDGAY